MYSDRDSKSGSFIKKRHEFELDGVVAEAATQRRHPNFSKLCACAP